MASGCLELVKSNMIAGGIKEIMREEKAFDEVGMRRAQEALANMLRGGHHKTLINFQKTLFVSYINAGFTREEAFILLRDWNMMGKNAQAQL